MSESVNATDECIARSHDANPAVRRLVVREMCPCKTLRTVDKIWTRLFEMCGDPDAVVRYNVVHTLCDGSPKEKETEIVESLETLWNDPDEAVRRRVRRALNSYRRCGNWNVL